MSYKVFFVEDEIVTREGIRDNVDWQADGFELCGEASDGEVALPMLQAAQPDVLITDIKMPFMDGLQLSQIVRDRMPRTKIVILSGHDEFEYAQKAIQLGITEYLLKPVTVQDMHKVLQRVAQKIDQETQAQAKLDQLRNQVNENRAALTERLLLQVLVGAVSPTQAIAQSELLGLDLVARCYLVVVIRLTLDDASTAFDYQAYQHVQDLAARVVGSNPDVFVLRKDLQELVLIMKGGTPDYLQQDRDFLIAQIQRQVAQTHCTLTVGVGTPRTRITDIGQSFIEALAQLQNQTNEPRAASDTTIETTELLKVDKSAVLDYLKCGVQEEFDAFFNAFIAPLGETAFRSAILKNYIVMDLVFTTAHLVTEWGGDVQEILPGLEQIESVLTDITTIEQLKEHAHQILSQALTFRDNQANTLHGGIIRQAREYIEQHYMDPDISLTAIAAQVGHSPCHFSTVFSAETGHTFKEYLTDLRIKRAKELIRTTTLRSSEISDRVGYNDPHYFSLVFRTSTGISPKEFRLQTQRV